MINKVLLLLFHPRLENSTVNSKINSALTNNQNMLVKDMYDLYPDFSIDVKAEKDDLLTSDIIIIQHPMYWYSAPPLYKQWVDLVFEYGWAYGKNGDKLRGKSIFHIISSGGSYESYCREGKNIYTYQELMRPFELTYKLCQMNYLPPYIIPSSNRIEKEVLNNHTVKIQQMISQMVKTEVAEIISQEITYLNDLKLR